MTQPVSVEGESAVPRYLRDWRRRRRPLPAAPPGWVYFIEAEGDQPIKIGWAKNLKNRCMILQTSHWRTLRVVGAIPGSRRDELVLHVRLKAHRIRGEWFEREAALALLTELREQPTELRSVA